MIPMATKRTKNNRDEQKWTRSERNEWKEWIEMMTEAALLLMLAVGIGLLAGLLYSAVRGDIDSVILFGVAMLTGLSTVLALICAVVLAIVFGVRGDGRKAVYSIAGLVLGIVLWVGVVALLSAGLMAEA